MCRVTIERFRETEAFAAAAIVGASARAVDGYAENERVSF
jgi:hypothetical protein